MYVHIMCVYSCIFVHRGHVHERRAHKLRAHGRCMCTFYYLSLCILLPKLCAFHYLRHFITQVCAFYYLCSMIFLP